MTEPTRPLPASASQRSTSPRKRSPPVGEVSRPSVNAWTTRSARRARRPCAMSASRCSSAGVHAAVGDEPDEVDALGAGERGAQDLVLGQRAVGDRLVDAREVLLDDGARAEVEVADLAVAHLPVGQADRAAARVELSCAGSAPRGRRTPACSASETALPGPAARAPSRRGRRGPPTGARPRLRPARRPTIAAKVSGSSEAPPTSAPSTSGQREQLGGVLRASPSRRRGRGRARPRTCARSPTSARTNPIASCACSGVATLPCRSPRSARRRSSSFASRSSDRPCERLLDLMAQPALGVAAPRAPPRSPPRTGSGAARPRAPPGPSAAAPGRSRRSTGGARSGRAASPCDVELLEHPRRHLAGERALGASCMFCAKTATRVPRAVSTQRRSAVNGTQIATSTPSTAATSGSERVDVRLRLRDRLVHLPVARDERGATAQRRTSTPGRVFPSTSSSDAPPPVDTCVTSSCKPNFVIAATESPPPTTVVPGAGGNRIGDLARPRRERLELERAHGAVPEDRAGAAHRARRTPRRSRGPMSRPIQPAGTSTPSSSLRSVSAENSRPSTRSTGRRSLRSRRAARRAGSAPSCLAQRVADVVALRREEREAHRPADEHLVGDLEELSSTPILSVTFAPPTTATNGRAGSARIDVQRLDLALQQQPGGATVEQQRHAVRRGVRAVRGAERVVDVGVGERAVALARAPGRPWSRPGRSARSRAGRRRRRARRRAPARSPTCSPSSSSRRVAHGPQRQLRVGALRPAEMAGEDEPRALLAQRARASERGPDPRVVGDRRPPSSGTLKSTRTKTRLPETSPRSERVLTETGWATRTC